jgi:hypothetical protein
MAAMVLLSLFFGYYLGNIPALPAAVAAADMEQALALDIFGAEPPLSLARAVNSVYGPPAGEGR